MSTMHIGKHHFSRDLQSNGASTRTLDFRTRQAGSRSVKNGTAMSTLARLGLVVTLTIATLFVVLNGSEGVSPIGVTLAAALGALFIIVLQWGCFPSRAHDHHHLQQPQQQGDVEPHHRQTHVTLNH